MDADPVTLPGRLATAHDGARGFDVNLPLTAGLARRFAAAGYQFAARYIGRRVMSGRDLTADEARVILEAGLALIPVQHVELPGWQPSFQLGREYGANAARFARLIGFPKGVSVWCDLEEVRADAPAEDVIRYANAWHDAVHAAGYAPGLYVGYRPGLTATQLYRALKFPRYWGAYNLNVDDEPMPRGWMLKQHASTGGEFGAIGPNDYDDDTARADHFGDRVPWLAPRHHPSHAAPPEGTHGPRA